MLTAENSPKKPALDFKNIHMSQLLIEQKTRKDTNDAPNYHISLSWRMYAVDNTTIEYESKSEPETESNDDFYAFALEQAAQGNTEPVAILDEMEDLVRRFFEVMRPEYGTITKS